MASLALSAAALPCLMEAHTPKINNMLKLCPLQGFSTVFSPAENYSLI